MSREATFRKLVADFPQSPMGYFSLAKWCLENQRADEATQLLTTATQLDPNYSAAWLTLGEAFAAAGNKASARAAYVRALETPHAQRDMSLQSDLEARIVSLDEF